MRRTTTTKPTKVVCSTWGSTLNPKNKSPMSVTQITVRPSSNLQTMSWSNRLLVHSTHWKRTSRSFTRLWIWTNQSSFIKAVRASIQDMLPWWLSFCQLLIRKMEWLMEERRSSLVLKQLEEQQMLANRKLTPKLFTKRMEKKSLRLTLLRQSMRVKHQFAFISSLIEVALCLAAEWSWLRMPWSYSCRVFHQTANSKWSVLVLTSST